MVIRAQVLTMKERQFVSVAKLSGVSDFGIIFKEILPNLLPFIAAAFVGQVFAAVFASFYLAVLGLGPLREPLLGNIIWAAQSQGAFFNGWWWWPIEPSVAMILILGSLALINMGLDELANPRIGSRNASLPFTATGGRPVLSVEHLEATYYTDLGRAKALDDVSFTLSAGEKLGMVGESGSGKSTLALAMMRMIKAPGRIEGGRVVVGDTDLMSLSEEDMRKARLSKIAYIPQGAMNSLNPVTRIGAQMVDAVKSHIPGEPRSSII
eukprot:gene53427-71423_t